MPQSWSDWCWQLKLASSLMMGGAIPLGLQLLHAFSGSCALAQSKIVPDSTLGVESSVVTPNVEINGLPSDRISGGAIRGANLFHSFQEFNIDTARGAYFTPPAGIENILSRVTGGNASNILGTLGVLGNANLFLINPNGIIFGSNARLDVGGSFVASTANSLKLADGTHFSATEPQTTPLLTISVPIGLQFGVNPGRILVQGQGEGIRTKPDIIDTSVGLRVQPDQTLALVGGDVALTGGTLKTAGGRIELGSVAGSSLVSLAPTGKGWFLGYSDVQNFRDIQLSGAAAVDASGAGGGDIQVQGRQVTLKDGSQIEASTLASEPGGTLTVTASELVELIGKSDDTQIPTFLVAQVYKGATGAGGNVNLKTRRLSVQDGAAVSASTLGSGKGGNLTVIASESVKLVGSSSGLFTQTEAAGDAGDLTIATRRLSVQDGALILAGTFDSGKGGNLAVTASESVELLGSGSSLFTQTQGAGAAGDLTITTRQLSVKNGAVVLAGTGRDSSGKGGDLTVTASDSVDLVGYSSGLFTQTEGAGGGGNVTIAAGRLSVKNGALVSTITYNSSPEGQGGNLTVTASESVELRGTSPKGEVASGLYTQTEGAAPAGDLTINTRSLIVGDGAQVSASTFGQGQGGELSVNASNSVNLFGLGSGGFSSGLFTRTTGMGQGGNITVDTSAFRVADGAVVDAGTTAFGNGGNITVKADTFEAVNGGQLLASAFRGSSGLAGNITVNTTNSVTISGSFPTSVKRFIRAGSNRIAENDEPNSGLFVLSQGSGDAGNLELTARSLSLDNQGKLTAETASGDGGNITLLVQDLLLLRHGSNISTTAGTSSATGNGGNITINNTPFIVAVPQEDSNITANANEGKGGFIQITAQGIFGLERREQLTALSDITAFSQQNPELNGVVEINTPDVDLSRGLVALPAELVNASELIASGCGTPGRQRLSELIVTGRGGLPPSPSDTLSSDTVWSDLRLIAHSAENLPSSESVTQQSLPIAGQVVEAQGWVINDKGEVVLTAAAPTLTPDIPSLSPSTCHVP